MSTLQKSALIGFGALILSTVVIQASDVLRGVEGNLTGLVLDGATSCEEGSTLILLGGHSLCVDVYEASAGKSCPHAVPQSAIETQYNANAADCSPVSKPDVQPWRFVSLTQAQQLCARGGKRLPTSEEWYKIVSGFSDHASCNTGSGTQPGDTGSYACVTPSGIHDLIGNVWEWMDAQVVEGRYDDRPLPYSGYVSLVDSDGMVIETAADPKAEFGNDYAQTAHSGVRGVLRGGFYGSGEDAGIFAQNLSVPLDFKATGVGFRCVKDL